MLSKSAAKTFFLGGTGICALAFIILTFDTVKQLDARSNHDNLTPEALHGFKIWTDNNCMGCHTLMGEGAYYAPELTKVVDRRGKLWIRTFLKDPEAMFPGRRKMVKYDFFDPKLDDNAEKNISDVIEFLEWVGNIDLNEFPPKPDKMLSSGGAGHQVKKDAMLGAPPIFAVCSGCHQLGGTGGVAGPALDGVSNRYTAEELRIWLKNPSKVKPGTQMPNLGLSDEIIEELVIFLKTQKVQ